MQVAAPFARMEEIAADPRRGGLSRRRRRAAHFHGMPRRALVRQATPWLRPRRAQRRSSPGCSSRWPGSAPAALRLLGLLGAAALAQARLSRRRRGPVRLAGAAEAPAVDRAVRAGAGDRGRARAGAAAARLASPARSTRPARSAIRPPEIVDLDAGGRGGGSPPTCSARFHARAGTAALATGVKRAWTKAMPMGARHLQQSFTSLRRSAQQGFTSLRSSAQQGFTLVELMVVIVIIGARGDAWWCWRCPTRAAASRRRRSGSRRGPRRRATLRSSRRGRRCSASTRPAIGFARRGAAPGGRAALRMGSGDAGERAAATRFDTTGLAEPRRS